MTHRILQATTVLTVVTSLVVGLVPSPVAAQEVTRLEVARSPGSFVLGGAYGYGLGDVRLKFADGTTVRHESNFTNGYLRASIFVSPSVSIGAQYLNWSDKRQSGDDTMDLRLGAFTVTWFPSQRIYGMFGIGAGRLKTQLGLLEEQDYPPDTPPDERPPSQIVTREFSEDTVGLMVAAGYEAPITETLGMGIQLDVWYLETLEGLTSLVSSASDNINLYLW